jgi:hypothetical protein
MRMPFGSTAMVTLALAIDAAAALGQDGSSVMIQRDEGGTRVRHISMPNLEALRTPDFTRKDLPIFTEKLVLSEAQTEATGRRIDAYVSAFMVLTRELAVVAGPEAEFVLQPEGAPAGPRGGMLRPGPMGGPGVAFDDLEAQLPPGSQVGVSIAIGVDEGGDADGGGAPPQPSADVQVGIETPGGEDVSPELLAKFQERADALAAQVMEQVAAQQEARAAGEAPAGLPRGAGAMLNTPEAMEEHQAELKAKVDEFLKDKAKLRSQFVGDVQSDLADEQIQRWPALERALTRERSLPKGRISGESTDLVKLVAAQKLAESEMATLATSIEAYEVDLDGALKRRDAFLADANQGIDEAISSGDPDKAIAIAERAADLRVAVRKTNQQHAEQIALELGGEQGAAFRSAALQAFYPRIYHMTRGQRMFAAIKQMDDLPTDLVAAVAESQASYDGELKALNDHIRQTIDREEPRERLRGLEQLKRTMRGEDVNDDGEPALTMPDDPIREALEKRADMDDRYLRSVASLLPADRASELPKPRTHKGPIVIRGGNSPH